MGLSATFNNNPVGISYILSINLFDTNSAEVINEWGLHASIY